MAKSALGSDFSWKYDILSCSQQKCVEILQMFPHYIPVVADIVPGKILLYTVVSELFFIIDL